MGNNTPGGFSLVELMVVITLIGLAATAVVLTFPAGGDTRAEGSRFAARAAALRDRAVIEGRPMRLWVTASGYGFDQRIGTDWQPLNDRNLSRADWTAGTAISVSQTGGGGRGDDARGQLSFNRTGLPSNPLTLTLRNGAQAQTLRITASGEVELR